MVTRVTVSNRPRTQDKPGLLQGGRDEAQPVMKEGKMIGSSWAAARTRRQLPQLSRFTLTCSGMAKRQGVGALHHLEPFKANRPLGMSVPEGQSK